MGIKTLMTQAVLFDLDALKNLPTTWGLRQQVNGHLTTFVISEKPPHHMGIKTFTFGSLVPSS